MLHELRGVSRLFCQTGSGKASQRKYINIELEGRIEFWQMSQGGGVYKFLGEGISQGMGFKNPQDVWVISSGPPAGRGKPSTFETGK